MLGGSWLCSRGAFSALSFFCPLLYGRHDRTTAIVPLDVERVFADVDADQGDCAARLLRHGVLLFGTPSQIQTLAVLEHGRTIPLAVISRTEIPRLSSLLTELC